MTRSPTRNLLSEGSAVLGIGFGIWLIHNAFQPGTDVPSVPLLVLGALDILLCFFILGRFLRKGLRDGEPLPGRWIAGGVILLAGFLGWIGALFLDSERLRAEEAQHREYTAQLAKLEDSVRHMADAMTNTAVLDRHAWDVNHDLYARLHDQLVVALRPRQTWNQDLTRIDEQVRLMQKAYHALPVENVAQQRLKLQGDFQLARDRAVQITETLRTAVASSERDVISHRHERWQGVGAAAITAVIFVLGGALLWLVFDHELRRSWKARTRLAESEVRYRGLIENGAEPLVILDATAAIVYANPVWKTVFGREFNEMLGVPLLELIHPEDRARVLSALQNRAGQSVLPCRLGANYDVWQDVEMQCEAHAQENVMLVRLRDVRETPEFKAPVQVEVKQDTAALQKLQDAEARIVELEARCEDLRIRERASRTDLDHHRWLLGSHKDVGNEGILILSTQGQVLSWNPPFAQLWKLSAETMSGHTWLTVAAHMETLTNSGWADFHGAASQHKGQQDSCWEMTLEDGKLLEVYAQALRDHPGNIAAVRFHFRDVTRQRDMELQIRGHDQHLASVEADLREREKRLKQLEKQLHDRERRHEEMETTLLDHQDRLHRMHQTQEDLANSIKAHKDAMRRLASGVANELHTFLSVIVGNTDVLRDNLPVDHVAQNYLHDIHQAAGRGTELAQHLLAYGRNHLLTMTPMEMNEQLESFESKIRPARASA